MKKFLLGLAVFAGVYTSNAQVFSSDMSSWTNDSLTDWFGAKTSLHVDSVMQITGQSNYGTSAASLQNASSSHKRFSTQTVSVTDGEVYEVTFWAKGAGELRTGIYDGRTGGFGYYYNSYITMDDANWTEYTQTIIADTSNANAEFLFSLRNTEMGNSILIDSVVINVNNNITTTSIYDIQYTQDQSGNSPYMDQTVQTGGIVTAVSSSGYYIQAGTGMYSALYVYDSQNTVTIGDSIIVSGMIVEYYTLTELSNVAAVDIVSSGNTVPTAEMLSTGSVGMEGWESVLVEVTGTVSNPDAGFGMFEVNDNSGVILVDDPMYQHTATLAEALNVTGVVDYSYDEWKILPRMQSDVVVVTSVEENEVDFTISPNPVVDYVSVNTTATNSIMEVYAITGELVLSFELNGTNNRVDLSELASGTYIVKVSTENSNTVKVISK